MKIKLKRIGKNGQGHIEMIISFVLFLGAVFLIFILLNPFAKTETKDLITPTKNILLKNITKNVGVITAIVNNSSSDCYDGSAVSTKYGNSFIEVKDPDPRLYTLYFNLSGSGAVSCSSLPWRNFTLGSYSNEEFISYDSANALVNFYKSDYTGLKNSLGIANDFSFNFTDLNRNQIIGLSVSRDIPEGVNVYSENIPVRVINDSAAINQLILNIRAW